MFEYLLKIYKGKKVFVTGHTGFKGAWLIKTLSLLQADVKGYALEPQSQPALYSIINGDNLCESVIADIRDKQQLAAAITAFEPDFIFHLAAQPLVRLSYQQPAETFEVNAIGTANVLDAMGLLQKPCCAVLITTDKVYHNYEWERPYHENDRLGGYDPYSASKACTELVIDAYRNSFFNVKDYHKHQKAIAVGRAGNVIGGGDWSADRLIPDIVRALQQNKEIEIRNPAAVRPWQHVLEPLFGYLLLGARLRQQPQAFSQAYNFGPYVDDALPVSAMVEMAISEWGAGKYFVKQNADQPHEAGLLKLDISKAGEYLKWSPLYNAAQAVKATIGWYKAYFNQPAHIIDHTTQQIMEFFQKATYDQTQITVDGSAKTN